MSQNSVDLAVANMAVVGDQVAGRLSTNVDWTARRRRVIVAAGIDCACIALKKHAMHLHHPIDTFSVWPRAAFAASVTAQDGVNPAISVGWDIGDDRFVLMPL